MCLDLPSHGYLSLNHCLWKHPSMMVPGTVPGVGIAEMGPSVFVPRDPTVWERVIPHKVIVSTFQPRWVSEQEHLLLQNSTFWRSCLYTRHLSIFLGVSKIEVARASLSLCQPLRRPCWVLSKQVPQAHLDLSVASFGPSSHSTNPNMSYLVFHGSPSIRSF